MRPATTLQQLADLEAIVQLKYRYLRHLHLKEWDALAACRAPDARASYDSGRYSLSAARLSPSCAKFSVRHSASRSTAARIPKFRFLAQTLLRAAGLSTIW